MKNLKVGDCLHKKIVCTNGIHQNYLCPYIDIKKCPCAIEITEQMAERWNNTGILILDKNNKVLN